MESWLSRNALANNDVGSTTRLLPSSCTMYTVSSSTTPAREPYLLVEVQQAKQITPVPYRPALLGLVERFHRMWKDMVSLYVVVAQDDWDRWLSCASYAYNGAKHSGTGYSPHELMMGRRLRAPNELLRSSGVTYIGDFAEYHRAVVEGVARAARV